jgi:hypothetical protein
MRAGDPPLPRDGLGAPLAGRPANLRYVAVSTAIGLLLGWLPALVHGPVAEKWNVHGVHGGTLVAGYFVARLSIGFWSGAVVVPRAWFLRGPICGALAMLPLGFVGLSNDLCGGPCMFWNTATAAAVGFATAGIAWSITGRHSAIDD